MKNYKKSNYSFFKKGCIYHFYEERPSYFETFRNEFEKKALEIIFLNKIYVSLLTDSENEDDNPKP